ncbi:2'-5' RNA ligase family protein [Cyanobacteria bacterium FACHB-502]|nr:2'-5' RNA ligase family protein [Cyanobacteria bacterium FACHB-502]
MQEPNRLSRCIFAPVLLTSTEVTEYRRRFDSLYGKCSPHVTLVFPFASAVPDAVLADALENIAQTRDALEVTLLAPELMDDCVVLPLANPSPWFRETHERLSVLAVARVSDQYRPHVTIGRDVSTKYWPELRFPSLASGLHTRLDRIVLEEIQPDESSRIVYETRLRA